MLDIKPHLLVMFWRLSSKWLGSQFLIRAEPYLLYGRCQAFLAHDFVFHFTKHSKNLWNDCNLHEQIDAYIYCLLHRYSRNVESELLKMTISRKNTLDVYTTNMFLYFSMKTINILYLQGSVSFMSITISKMST